MKKIPVELKSFSKLIKDNYYFVDKTLLIKDFLELGSEATLITRPRRFGKTINMSMMAEFFDITKDSRELFKDTLIMQTPYASEMNQYPTIFLSFADAKREKDTIISKVKKQLLKEWRRHKDVFKNLDEFDQPIYDSIFHVLSSNNNDLIGIDDALSFLMERLEEFYGKEVMLFIDEYDTPFNEAHIGGFYDDVKSGLAGLLHNSL